MQSVMSEFVDAALTGALTRVCDSEGDVLEPELALGQQGDLEHDPPCACEVGDVDLQATGQSGAGGMFRVAVPAFGGGNALAFVPTARRLECAPGSFGLPGEIGGEQTVVEVDGRPRLPSGMARQAGSALAVRRQRWPVPVLEFFELGPRGGAPAVAGIDVAHRLRTW